MGRESEIKNTNTHRTAFISKDLRPVLKGQFIHPIYKHDNSKENGKIFLHPLNEATNLEDFLAD